MLLAPSKELFELLIVFPIPNVEAKGHGGVKLRVVHLLGSLLMVGQVVLADAGGVFRHRILGVVGVQDYHLFVLETNNEVGFLGTPADYPHVQILGQECSDCSKVLT